jgi:hypothetical protein
LKNELSGGGERFPPDNSIAFLDRDNLARGHIFDSFDGAADGPADLNRTWKAGDKIQSELPMHLHIEAMPDDASMQAVLYGPLVLAGDLGRDGLTQALIIGRNRPRLAPRPGQPVPPNLPPDLSPPAPEIEIPTFRAAGDDPDTWIKPGDPPLTFTTAGQARIVTLIPLNSIFGKRYSVYRQVS